MDSHSVRKFIIFSKINEFKQLHVRLPQKADTTSDNFSISPKATMFYQLKLRKSEALSNGHLTITKPFA
jgi:hypothetical protein